MILLCCISGFIKLIIPPAVSVFVGGIIIQRYFVRKSNQASFIDHIITELSDLRKDSLEYWSTSTTPDNEKNIKHLENRIKGLTHSILSDLNYFKQRADSKFWLWRFFYKTNPSKESTTYIVEMLDVYDICTGGDFESTKHSIDESKYFEICSSISKVKSELFKIKI